MDFAYSAEDEAFRDELRAWLDEHLPKFLAEWGDEDAEARRPTARGQHGIMGAMERRRAWQRTLNEGRWAAINWPGEWGGRDATVTQNVIYSEEMARARTPGIYNANGLWQIGPMIIRWGTDEQKDRWVPNILNADDHWCQGFSEPEAGSDLANLRTLAVRDGDDYVLNGQKIWISSAHIAKWGLFLVRTDPTAIERGAKHEGITALIVDLEADGIECRPIRDIAGEEMFNEVFFTDARVPVAVPPRRRGRGLAGGHGHARPRAGRHRRPGHHHEGRPRRRWSLARAVNPDALDDPELRERIARAHTDIEYTRLLNYRALSKILKGEPNWPEVPLAKLQWSHLAQTLAELAVDLLGPSAVLAKGGPDAVDGGAWNRLLRVPALHVDRRRHHRGAEEHHRRHAPSSSPRR